MLLTFWLNHSFEFKHYFCFAFNKFAIFKLFVNRFYHDRKWKLRLRFLHQFVFLAAWVDPPSTTRDLVQNIAFCNALIILFFQIIRFIENQSDVDGNKIIRERFFFSVVFSIWRFWVIQFLSKYLELWVFCIENKEVILEF